MGILSGIYRGSDGVGKEVCLSVEADGGITPIRDRYKNIRQTFNPQGQLISVLYTFQGGGTITDTFTYGSNSLTEPENVYRGDLILPVVIVPGSPTTLTNFLISTDGTKLNYTATLPVTALTGSISVGGVSRTLTHVSSGIASFSGVAISSSVTGITVTIASCIPTLSANVTNASVTNNSTLIASTAPVLTALTWSTTNGGTQTGENIAIDAANRGSVALPTLSNSAPFEVVITAWGDAQVVYFDTTNNPSYAWENGTSLIYGLFMIGGGASLYETRTAANSNVANIGAGTAFTKLAKSGNDLIVSQSINGSTYTVLKTLSGILAGTTALYLKTLAAGGASSANIKLFV